MKHVTRYEKSREEREYDIVLGRFRDEDKEQGYQQREGVELKCTLEKGRVRPVVFAAASEDTNAHLELFSRLFPP